MHSVMTISLRHSLEVFMQLYHKLFRMGMVMTIISRLSKEIDHIAVNKWGM